jgi:hypothetical protein
LAHPLLINLPTRRHGFTSDDNDSTDKIDSWYEMVRLVEDEEPGVRAAALRALGLKIKLNPSTDINANQDQQERVMKVARICEKYCGKEDDEEIVKISASWSLANCFDRFESR